MGGNQQNKYPEKFIFDCSNILYIENSKKSASEAQPFQFQQIVEGSLFHEMISDLLFIFYMW